MYDEPSTRKTWSPFFRPGTEAAAGLAFAAGFALLLDADLAGGMARNVGRRAGFINRGIAAGGLLAASAVSLPRKIARRPVAVAGAGI